jgi:hypothetical protein
MTALIHTLFPPETAPAKIKGEVRFVTAGERSSNHGSLGLLLTVCVPPPPWSDGAGSGGPRGRLRDAIESAIESALDLNDAPPAGVGDLTDLDQCLSDQLYRARSVGAGGLVLCLPDLMAAGSLAGALDAEDSAVLRWWIAATAERPVMLLLDGANRHLSAYGPPTRLDQWVEQKDPPAQLRRDKRDEDVPCGADKTPVAPPVESPAHGDHGAEEQRAERLPAKSHVALMGFAGMGGAAERATAVMPDAEAVNGTRASEERASRPPGEEFSQAASQTATDRVVTLFPGRESPFRKSSVRAYAPGGPIDWRGFANDLALARGPKPLTFVERLFMTRYIPLLDSLARGEADEAARRTADQWAEDFARSYTEGFSALRVTGKRPRMVLDAPQLASQVARLHGAKSTQLVLVDAMRFDLGLRVHDRMCEALTSQATCTERLLLWAALPTTTPAQLDLLAHGPEGLASRPPAIEQEESGLRGRGAPMLRRIKLGGRDVLKLDVVQARLHEAGPPLSERLDAMADEVTTALAAHARNLPPRSLMMVFGDHGFRMESSEQGTSAGSSGGASPEEVLVPGFAWLIGDVH